MKSDKFLNSIFYKICEKIYQLIILNVLTFITLIFGLFIFSALPAFTSLVLVLKSCNNERDIPLFKSYFKSFFKYYKKSEVLSISYFVLLGLFIFNSYYFYCWTEESSVLFYAISYYFSLLCVIITLLAFINVSFVFVYFPHLNIKKMIKYSFVLLKVQVVKALIMLLILTIFIYLAVLVVYLLPFILISLYFYFFYLLINSTYLRLVPKDIKSLDIVLKIEEERNKNL